MHIKFLKLLKCPITGSPLKLKVARQLNNGFINDGTLISANNKHVYPIINGIPRFVDKQLYSGSFGYEWHKWPKVQFESENIGKPMQGHTTKMFQKITRSKPTDIKGKYVVEFGCGSGRFLDLVKSWGAYAVGIDMSRAVDAARHNFANNPNILIVQGDVLNPPFRENSFDYGYSIGVLHHTPHPQKGLQALADLIKPAGRVACCVYPKGGFYDFPSVFWYRKIHNKLKQIFGAQIGISSALAYSYFSAYPIHYLYSIIRHIPYLGDKISMFLIKYLLIELPIRDPKWRILDTFDAITPYFASTHTYEELVSWFKQAKLKNITQTDWCATSVIATK